MLLILYFFFFSNHKVIISLTILVQNHIVCIFLSPQTVNCWPSENDGQCDVNIEYELLQENLELNDVVISIPVP